MNEIERMEYLEGKVKGLDRLSQVLVNHIETFWKDLPSGLEWRIGFQTELLDLIAGLEKGNSIMTPLGKGQRDAIAEFASKLFSR